MKKFFYLSLAAAAMLAVGCDKEQGSNQPFDPATSGNGFLAFNVATPTTPATKANDVFVDGSVDEYRVEDIILVLFTGASEETATLASAYNLSEQRTAFGTVGTPTDQITSTTSNAALVAEIKRSTLKADEKAFAFIILNDHQFVSVEPSTADLLASNKLWEQSDSDATAARQLDEGEILTGWTFSKFKKLALDESGRNFANASFLMSNAPVATEKANSSWAGKLTTLVEFDKTKIHSTRQAALLEPACTINVERALAKVTCYFASSGKLENNQNINFEILGWDLDNYNLMGYITRNFNDSAIPGFNGEVDFSAAMQYRSQYYTTGDYGFRFSSPNPIAITGEHPYNTNVYRTYWGQDVNYTGDAKAPLTTGAPLNSKQNTSLNLDELRASGTTYYCPENTFDINHQTVRNTTRLVLAAKLNGGNPFFTLQEHATTLYPDDAAASNGSMQKFLNDAVANRVNVRNWAVDYIDAAIDQSGNWAEGLFTVTFVDALTAEQTGSSAIAAVPGMKYALVAVNPLADLSKFKGADETAKVATRSAAVNSFAATLAPLTQHYLANSYKLYYFEGGVTYYQALIKHFGDYETPWNSDPTMSNTIESIYGQDYADRDFLGRYGIVRNNWYQLSVDGIRNIGSSVVPPLTDVPDDSVENYLSVRINILPWAVRVQGGIVL